MQEASDCRAKLTRDMLELGKIVTVKTGHVSRLAIQEGGRASRNPRDACTHYNCKD